MREHICESETNSQTWRTDLRLSRGMVVGKGRIWSVGLADVSYYIKDVRVKSKVLPYSTGHYTQHPVINYSGKESQKEYIKIPFGFVMLYKTFCVGLCFISPGHAPWSGIAGSHGHFRC